MRIMIVWMVLHELRLAESTVRHRRWSEPQQFEPNLLPSKNHAATEIAELLNQRWTWSRNCDGLLRFWFELLPDQRKRTTAVTAAVDDGGPGPTWTRVLGNSACSCESEGLVRDLGSGHYPRYLSASRCKPETCQNKFHPCKLIKYTVYVLRLRDANNTGTNAMLPESLRHKWLMKPITVAVACMPASDAKRN